MPIDLTTESPLVRLGDVPDLRCLPRRRRGRKLHKSTPFRWANPGVRGIRLEVIRVGGTLCTTVPALQRFFERLAALPSSPDSGPSKGKRRHPGQVAEALDREGL
jgi:hypothetical protein